MTTTPTTATKPSTKTDIAPSHAQHDSNPLNQLHEQQVATLTGFAGVYVGGAVEDYKVGDDSGKFGFIQILQRQRDNSAALKLTRIKVKEDRFGLIEMLNKSVTFSYVTLMCEVSENYQGKMQIVLAEDQPSLKIS